MSTKQIQAWKRLREFGVVKEQACDVYVDGDAAADDTDHHK